MLILTFGLLALGYALYYGAQAFGVEAITAGNYVQLFIFLVICVGYTSTYIFRVANKVNQYSYKQKAPVLIISAACLAVGTLLSSAELESCFSSRDQKSLERGTQHISFHVSHEAYRCLFRDKACQATADS